MDDGEIMTKPMIRQPRTLPDHFHFSQSSLQAYLDCPRLFQLRYIERLTWPASEVEPSIENEQYMVLGSSFHQLVQQYYLGLRPDRLGNLTMRDPLLNQWWHNFIQNNPETQGYTHQTEITFTIPIDRYRLVAKFDLLVYQQFDNVDTSEILSPGTRDNNSEKANYIIFDWKTSRKFPARQWLESKMQTIVYPFTLVKAGDFLLDRYPIQPSQVKMVYWFSNFPTTPIQFNYNQEKYRSDEAMILSLIDEIKNINSNGAQKTEKQEYCQFCVYRSLCNRGVNAGSFVELEEDATNQNELMDTELEIDFEQIAEIEF